MSFIGDHFFKRSARTTGGGWFEQPLTTKRPKTMRGAGFFNWLRSGRTDAQHVGGRGLGIETMETFGETADHDGTRHGIVRNPNELVKGDDAAMHRFVKGGSKVRKGEVKADSHRGMAAAKERLASAPKHAEAKRTYRGIIDQRLLRTIDKRDKAEAKIEPAEEKLQEEQKRYEALPRSQRGYFESKVLLTLLEVFVVVFDAFVIHGALENGGMSPTTAWGTSVTVPLAIFAANHTAGWLAGAIGLAVPGRAKLKVAAATFAVGFGVLLAAFIALAVFREQAMSSQNASLNALANSRGQVNLHFLVSPLWMGPLQCACSILIASAVALYTMAKPGRDQQDRIKKAQQTLADHKNEVKHIDARVEGLHRDGEAADLAAHEIEADKAVAESTIALREQVLNDQLEAEDGLCEAVEARGDTEYEISRKLYENGGVSRCAMPTVQTRFGRRYTPGPQDVQGASATPPPSGAPSRNGHEAEREVGPDSFNPRS